MTERPILFSGPMVRAILDGRKTQTRRLVKPVRGYEHNNVCRPDMAADPGTVWWHGTSERVGCLQPCPYGEVGTKLWVRETWKPAPYHLCGAEGCDCDDVKITYPADGASRVCTMPEGWTPPGGWARYERSPLSAPSIHMPRWASRLSLEVTSVRVERLQNISEEDATAEGCVWSGRWSDSFSGIEARERYGADIAPNVAAFAELWDSINGDRATWDSNPWVWCVGFKRVGP